MGAVSVWWMVTTGLISHYSDQQSQFCERQLDRCCAALGLLLTNAITGSIFAKRLGDHRLQVIAEPDITVTLRVRRAAISSPLIASLALILVGYMIEAQIRLGLIPRDAGAVHWWLSTFAMISCILAAGATIFLAVRFDGVAGLRELAQWNRLRDLFHKEM